MHNPYANPYNQSEHPFEHTLYEDLIAATRHAANMNEPWFEESLLFGDEKCPRRDAPPEFVKKVLRFMNEDTFFDHIQYSVSMYESRPLTGLIMNGF